MKTNTGVLQQYASTNFQRTIPLLSCSAFLSSLWHHKELWWPSREHHTTQVFNSLKLPLLFVPFQACERNNGASHVTSVCWVPPCGNYKMGLQHLKLIKWHQWVYQTFADLEREFSLLISSSLQNKRQQHNRCVLTWSVSAVRWISRSLRRSPHRDTQPNVLKQQEVDKKK